MVGRLTVTGWAGSGQYGGNRRSFWHCLCQCGVQTVRCLVLARSCGCAQQEARSRQGHATGRKTALLIAQVKGREMSLREAARVFHVKLSTLRARQARFPADPARWFMPTHKPMKVLFNFRKKGYRTSWKPRKSMPPSSS